MAYLAMPLTLSRHAVNVGGMLGQGQKPMKLENGVTVSNRYSKPLAIPRGLHGRITWQQLLNYLAKVHAPPHGVVITDIVITRHGIDYVFKGK